MANYAFFRPTNLEVTKAMDEFANPGNSYDLNKDTHTKLDIDGSYTGDVHASGLTFLPKSQASCYLDALPDHYGARTISESLPAGAIIIGGGCGTIYSSNVSSLGNTPLIQYGVTQGKSSTPILFNSSGSHEPPKGNTSQIYARQSGFDSFDTLNTTNINYTTDWVKNNVNLWFSVTGRHGSVISSTVIKLREIWFFARWALPLNIRSLVGCTSNYANLTIHEFNSTCQLMLTPLKGYTCKDAKITFHKGNVSWSYNPSDYYGYLTIPMVEGVEISIEFQKKKQLYVDKNKVEKILIDKTPCSMVLFEDAIVYYDY